MSAPTTDRPARRPQRRMAEVLEDYAELREQYPNARRADLAPRLRMSPAGLERMLQRARARAAAGQQIPGSPGWTRRKSG